MKISEMLTRNGAAPDSALTGRWLWRPVLAAQASDDVRWERVAQLKAAIEAGTYSVSSEALAERLIEHRLRKGTQGRVEGDL
jgi:hypothetical protein